MGRGGGGGASKLFSPMIRGQGGRKGFQFYCTPPHPVLNDKSFILLNFEGLVLLSPSEIKRELCKLMISISQGIHRYKVPVVGKNGKLNETIERSALWSTIATLKEAVAPWRQVSDSPISLPPTVLLVQYMYL